MRYYYFLLICFISCSSENEELLIMEPEPEQIKLINTIWESPGVNCTAYFDFRENAFISSNSCYDANGQVAIMSWESGTYTRTSARLNLKILDSCDPTKVGITLPFFYEITNDSLFLGFNFDDLKLRHALTQDPPMVADDTRFGYFDFGGTNQWVDVETCRSPYGL